jgi:hypothetical protein
MKKQTVAIIALFAGWIVTAEMANATTYKDIAGQWCGDITEYVFAPTTLTVKFHDRRPSYCLAPASFYSLGEAKKKLRVGRGAFERRH